jgi:hypothetical protein
MKINSKKRKSILPDWAEPEGPTLPGPPQPTSARRLAQWSPSGRKQQSCCAVAVSTFAHATGNLVPRAYLRWCRDPACPSCASPLSPAPPLCIASPSIAAAKPKYSRDAQELLEEASRLLKLLSTTKCSGACWAYTPGTCKEGGRRTPLRIPL